MEARSVESWQRQLSGCSVVIGFVLGWWDVADGAEHPTGVEPVDPLERGELDVSMLRQGPRGRMSSVLYSPMMVMWSGWGERPLTPIVTVWLVAPVR